MPHLEERFQTDDGLQLCEYHWLPEGDPSAVVVLVHGFTEHCGRYAELAQQLTRHGYAVYATDLRGHGKSEGEPAFVHSFDEYLADLDLAVDRARMRLPDKPLFLLGHSLGGALVVLLAIRRARDFHGLVASAGSFRVGGQVFPILRRIAVLVSRLLPRLRMVRMGARMLSRDPKVIDDFKNDPLVFHGRFPVRAGAEILRAARQVQSQMESVQVPLLILHGTGDRVTSVEGSRQLYARAASTDKTLKLYEGLYHDLFHEPEKEQVTSDVIRWFNTRR